METWVTGAQSSMLCRGGISARGRWCNLEVCFRNSQMGPSETPSGAKAFGGDHGRSALHKKTCSLRCPKCSCNQVPHHSDCPICGCSNSDAGGAHRITCQERSGLAVNMQRAYCRKRQSDEARKAAAVVRRRDARMNAAKDDQDGASDLPVPGVSLRMQLGGCCHGPPPRSNTSLLLFVSWFRGRCSWACVMFVCQFFQ